MSLIKTLWASVQGDPVFMRRVNGWLTIFWILMIPRVDRDEQDLGGRLRVESCHCGRWCRGTGAHGRPLVSKLSSRKRCARPWRIRFEERVVEKIVEETTVQPVPATDTPAV